MIYETLSPHATLWLSPITKTYRSVSAVCCKCVRVFVCVCVYIYVNLIQVYGIVWGQSWGFVHYGKGVTVVKVRFSVIRTMTMRKLVVVPPIKTEKLSM